MREIKQEKERERIRFDRIRRGYLHEMRERRERELSKNLESRSQITSENKIDHSDHLSSSFKSYGDNQSDGYDPYSQSASKCSKSPTLTASHVTPIKLNNLW